MLQNVIKKLFDDSRSFAERALEVFKFQYTNNAAYKRFCDAFEVKPQTVKQMSEIPLLPIEAFKDTEIIAFEKNKENDLLFKSSGTGSSKRSKHRVLDQEIYRESVVRGFNTFFDPKKYILWSYLPGYSKNPHSSLIWMVKTLIEETESQGSRFLTTGEPITDPQLDQLKQSKRTLMLFGAAFGLLDLLEMKKVQLPEESIIIETGGMKTHRRSMTRRELHQRLSEGFGIPNSQIYSEYGMAEMLSQAYMLGNNYFKPVPWLKFSIRNTEKPFEEVPAGTEGLIGIIDLANYYSCSFLLTGDRGRANAKGEIKVLGRWNPDDMRGCNFLIEDEL